MIKVEIILNQEDMIKFFFFFFFVFVFIFRITFKKEYILIILIPCTDTVSYWLNFVHRCSNLDLNESLNRV